MPPLPSQSANICTKAHATLLRALTRLTQVVYFRTPIRIKATFSSFCDSSFTNDVAQCRAENDVLGSAGPSTWHVFNSSVANALGVDPEYMYPSALAKQYVPEEFPSDSYDIAASFNSDPLWWFPTQEDPIGRPESKSWNANKAFTQQWSNQPDPATKLDNRVFDFEQIVLHEFLHGLGFISSWYPWMDSGSILPQGVDKAENDSVIGLAKPYLFNKWMADAGREIWMRDYEAVIAKEAEEVARRVIEDGEVASWEDVFRTTSAYNLSKIVYKSIATKPGALAIWYPIHSTTSDPIFFHYAILYTPKTYSPGSTFSHVDNGVYSGTGQFLMRAFGTGGVGLDGYVPKGEPIGEVVLGILRGMGYATALVPL